MHDVDTSLLRTFVVLAETGIVGFTVWLAIVGYCFRMMMAIVNREDDIIDDVPMDVPDEVALREWQTDKALSLCLLISLCGFFTAAFFLQRRQLDVQLEIGAQ